jgi:hypothetical protein
VEFNMTTKLEDKRVKAAACCWKTLEGTRFTACLIARAVKTHDAVRRKKSPLCHARIQKLTPDRLISTLLSKQYIQKVANKPPYRKNYSFPVSFIALLLLYKPMKTVKVFTHELIIIAFY